MTCLRQVVVGRPAWYCSLNLTFEDFKDLYAVGGVTATIGKIVFDEIEKLLSRLFMVNKQKTG